MTAVFVTHDMAEALTVGDRIAVIHEGRLVQTGSPTLLMNRPANEYVGQLLLTPRRQAEVVDSLIAGATPN